MALLFVLLQIECINFLGLHNVSGEEVGGPKQWKIEFKFNKEAP